MDQTGLMTEEAPFVHLRVHSAYSLAESALKTKAVIKLCQHHAMPAVAVTDTNNLFGALEFATAAAGAGIQPIIGCEMRLRWSVEQGPGRAEPFTTLPLIAQTDTGYRNLLALVSRSFLATDPAEDAHIPLTALDGHTDGLICLTGGAEGPVGQALDQGRASVAKDRLATLSRLFGDRLYVEVQRHDREVEDRIEGALIDLAYAFDLPLVATNTCLFQDAGMHPAHDALLCIGQGTVIGNDDRRKVTAEYRFKSGAEMRALFADIPEAIDNTAVIAQRCGFLLKPINPILPPFDTAGGRSETAELRAQAQEGLEKRLQVHVYRADDDAAARADKAKPYYDRLERELGIIEAMGFPGYFLIVADFIQWAKARAIPVGPGRGSGAGSVVAWGLTITDLDPLRFNLLFERFLNPERVSMPDFDVDFCQDRRDEVIAYVQEKYGADKVAQIITFGKLQARAVVRDVGRVLAQHFKDIDRLCKMIPNNPANPVTLQEAIDGEPLLQEAKVGEETGRVLDIALKLEGLYRHASTHAAGVVIGDRPLQELVPLYRDPRAPMPVTQFNMKWVEQAGLVKFDFLGLKTLTVLQKAVDLVEQQEALRLDLSALPLDDPATYALMTRGETVGVFQLESTGMRDTLRKAKPDRFEDIIALVSLYRPGPMDNIPKYIAVKEGQEDPDYLHPRLKPILEETFGIMIYQEQVMQCAQELAGYSLGGADLLRRAMGKKIKEAMDAEREKFTKGATERGVEPDQAARIFDQMAKFAGYGFNKSHAAAYALIAYQTGFLKANYPVEFLAASMTLDLGNTDKLNVFQQELQRLEVSLLPPDVNASFADFAVERDGQGNKAIRYALGAIKGVGRAAMLALVQEREQGGPFADLFDLAARTGPAVLNKRMWEQLAQAGALDSLEAKRAQAFAAADMALGYGQAASQERESGQNSLFGAATGTELPKPTIPKCAEWESLDRLQKEFAAIGFYLSAHPLDGFAGPLRKLGAISYRDLSARLMFDGAGGSKLMAGIVTDLSIKNAPDGRRYAFVKLSDATGVFEIRAFDEALALYREILKEGEAVVLTVDASLRDDALRLTLRSAEPLDKALAKATDGLIVFVDQPHAVPAIRETLERQGKGRGRVTLVVKDGPAKEISVELKERWAVTGRERAAIKAVPGVIDVQTV
mgnify:CR=1 FL=1